MYICSSFTLLSVYFIDPAIDPRRLEKKILFPYSLYWRPGTIWPDFMFSTFSSQFESSIPFKLIYLLSGNFYALHMLSPWYVFSLLTLSTSIPHAGPKAVTVRVMQMQGQHWRLRISFNLSYFFHPFSPHCLFSHL